MTHCYSWLQAIHFTKRYNIFDIVFNFLTSAPTINDREMEDIRLRKVVRKKPVEKKTW